MFSNIYVAIPVVCLICQTMVQFNLEIEPVFLLFIYSATLFSYCFHRVFPFKHNKSLPLSKRHIWIEDNKLSFTIIMLFSLAGCSALFFILRENAFYLLLPAGFITFFYTVPLFRIGGKWKRLRDIPFLKIFIISLTATYISLLLPILYKNPAVNIINSDIWMAASERFFFLFAITIPFDIRDIKHDKETGLRTIPLFLGVSRSIRLAYFCIFIFLLISVVHYGFFQDKFYFLIAMIASGVFTVICISRISPDKSEYFFSLLIEGTMIFQFLMVCLALL